MKVVIIDHHKAVQESNQKLLTSNFPDMEIVGKASRVSKAIEVLKATKPDLVLMDIELRDGNAFQVLQACAPYTFIAIFITKNKTYAMKAIKFGIIDYILKPINEYEFCDAIKKAIVRHERNQKSSKQKTKEEDRTEKQKKIILKTINAIHLINVQDIIYCRSKNSYTTFYLNDGQSITVSKSIKEYIELLSEHSFIRPHQSYLVNTSSISRINKTNGGLIIMSDETEIPISKRLKQAVMEELSQISTNLLL